MSKQSDSPKKPRINRLEIGINVVIQTLLVLFIVGLINVAGFHYFKRWDVSRDKMRELSKKTLQVLKSLPADVKIYALYSPRDPLGQDIETLLKDVRTASSNKLDVEFINQYANITRTQEIQTKYKFGEDASLLIVDYKGKSKFLHPDDLTEWDRSNELSGQAARPLAFKGEQLLTSALIEVTETKPRKLYFLAGHGESDILNSDKFKAIRASIEHESIKMERLNLMEAPSVPEDASALFIAGPRFDLSQREAELLTNYWKGKGRLMVLLNPDADTPRLDDFLTQAGIHPEKDRVLGLKQSSEVAGLVIVESRVVGSYVGKSPVTKDISGVAGLVPAPVKSLTLQEDVAKPQNIKLEPLFMTAPGYWGEVDYATDSESIKFDEGKDLQGPLVIFAQAEKGAVGDQRVQLDSSRLVVAGGYLFIDTRAMDQGFLTFTISAVNWLTNREELIGVPPKEYKLLTLNVSDEQMTRVSWFVLIIMPLAAAIFGVTVWWRRRN